MITIIGGGAAGIGVGILLTKLGVEEFLIIEKEEIGASFLNWTKETRLITPSFTGHGFGLLDLNAVFPNSSPGYTLGTEHLTGRMYGQYLKGIAAYFKLPVLEKTEVTNIRKEGNEYIVQTNQNAYKVNSVILACGEYSFPKRPFQHGIHYADVESWSDFEGDRMIIGGGESAADAAFHLSTNGWKVDVYHPKKDWLALDADPSRSLSPFTRDRLKGADSQCIHEHPHSSVVSIDYSKKLSAYTVTLKDGSIIETKQEPLLCTGFHSGAAQFHSLFEWTEDGLPIVNEYDESTLVPSVYLTGPSLRQRETIFCFIYKFRQRFAIFVEHLLRQHHISYDKQALEEYKQSNMYLDDLTCCEAGCEC